MQTICIICINLGQTDTNYTNDLYKLYKFRANLYKFIQIIQMICIICIYLGEIYTKFMYNLYNFYIGATARKNITFYALNSERPG